MDKFHQAAPFLVSKSQTELVQSRFRHQENRAPASDFFRPVDFRAVFSADDLFPFDPTGIALLITDVRENAPSFEEDGKADRFGIWLDEEE